MKTLCVILKTAIFAFLGAFLGSSLFQWLDYTANPQRYVMQSAPWYLSIQINGILTLAVTALLLLLLYFIRRRMK